jgi:hypothetical protein
MNKFILGEKLKEEINGRRIKAALFHSFNFDPDFFENYLLPLFLPDIPFGDNKIQNTILWKKYQNELPPVTVYCDFHAKAQKGIHLDYIVRTVDIIKVNGVKPCFHPKHSSILLDDDTLLLFIGSNNLTEAGWCSNLEGVNFFKLKSGEYFPREFKNQIRNFNKEIPSQNYNEHSPADDLMESFFRKKIGYTDEVDFKLLNSKDFREENNMSYFGSFLSNLCLEGNDGIPFKKIEIVSPYYSSGISMFETLIQTTNCSDISCSIPFENSDFVALEQTLFDNANELGINWKAIKGMNETKGHRFNHSKIYQFLGEKKVFILAGSINFTNMAWKGIRQGGNYESAILYTLPAEEFESILIDYPTDNLSFSGAKPEENLIDGREDAFDLSFVIDWVSKEIEIVNNKSGKQKGEIIIDNLSNIRINKSKKVLLNEEQLCYFSNTPLIKVKPQRKNYFFYYYPIHKNINAKPLPSNINLNDTELLQLWMDLEGAKDKESTLRIIDRFIDRIMDESGDLNTIELNNTSSTLNLMATHLSGLIHLNKKLFTNESLKKPILKNKMLEYYLFGDNVDTIIGYRKLILKMRKESRLNNGFYWLLLNIISKTFYQKYEVFQLNGEKNEELIKLTKLKIKELDQEIKLLGKGIENERITAAHLKWAEQILLNDA